VVREDTNHSGSQDTNHSGSQDTNHSGSQDTNHSGYVQASKLRACFDKLSMTALNGLRGSLRKCFDKLSMTALNNFNRLKLKNNVSLSLSKAV
jgi:hypothetical protein